MKIESDINNHPVYGQTIKVVTTFEAGERFYNIDGEDYICMQEIETTIDATKSVRDIILRKIIPIQTISLEAKLS